MKLKDKLAQEYAKEMGDRVYDYHAKLCFLAGFEKAREIAKTIHENCGSAYGCCREEMANLGEEEVSEEKVISKEKK